MEVIQQPEVAEKRQFLDKEQKTEEVSRVIDRPIDFKFSLSENFNKILEDKTGISADKVYSNAKASVAGRNKGRFKFFIPPSAEDFVGLLYATLTKGKKGDKQMDFYKETLLNPYAKAMGAIAKERMGIR